jgi:hypothetical protein
VARPRRDRGRGVTAERDYAAERDHAEWLGWAEAQGYATDDGYVEFDSGDMRDAFAAGMQAQRDLDAATKPAASGLGKAIAGAAVKRAAIASQEASNARAAAAEVMQMVPLGRHASPQEREQIRRALRAIVTGQPS